MTNTTVGHTKSPHSDFFQTPPIMYLPTKISTVTCMINGIHRNLLGLMLIN